MTEIVTPIKETSEPFKVHEVTIEKYHPETIIKDLETRGVTFDPNNEAYRCFLRTKDGKPLVSDYPDSTLSNALQNIQQYGVEYNPRGQSIGTLKQPLMTYAVPHQNFGDQQNQVGFIIVYNSKKNPELFASYATPKINDGNIRILRDCLKTVYRINYR